MSDKAAPVTKPTAGTGSITINVAFLREIKEDNVHFQELLDAIRMSLDVGREVRVRVLSELLGRLRDELETHFALEEFFGYFNDATSKNSAVCHKARKLCDEHRELFTLLNELVEESERLLYKETPGRNKDQIVEGFFDFYDRLKRHEQDEMELMMRLWNEDIGVGD